ncbi:protein of unknown function [Cupriavidus taiwanensis]|nr:protein of unknown function [Cupriavidus taiwanensis]
MHGIRANAEPSPSAWLGRCREQTAGTYGRKAMVKACSSPRTAPALAAKAEVGRKSLAARRAGSIPASGTKSTVAILCFGGDILRAAAYCWRPPKLAAKQKGGNRPLFA